MKKITLVLLLLNSFVFADTCGLDFYCDSSVPRTRADNIPQTHIANMSNEYMTGYIQSLVDMHYYEFQVHVIAHAGTIYVFDLPNNQLIAGSILCFIYDVPCVQCVERVDCCPEDFAYSLQQTNPEAAKAITCSNVYQTICCMPKNYCQIQAIWLPQNTVLFRPLIADPRQVMNAAALRFQDNVIGKHVGAVSFGDDFMVIRLKNLFRWHGDMDLGVQAGIFSVFDLDHVEACMVNTDFFVAAMATYAFDCWSFRFRLWHLSCHIGDEFLICNPDFDRCNLSDEGIDFFASYQFGQPLRIYGGLGYIYDRDDEFPEKPWYFEAGSEVRLFGGRDCFNKLYIQPFFAMNFRLWEEHDFELDQTYVLGIEWSKLQGVGRKLRLYGEYHNGFSKEGQFVRERSDYYAIKVNYGF